VILMKNILFVIFATFAAPVLSQQSEKNSNTLLDEVEEIPIDFDAPPASEAGCFSVRGIRNFSSLHDSYLYVEGRGNTHYLLTMNRVCLGLRNAQAVAIQNHRDRVCSNSQASVSYRGVGGRMEICDIKTIEKLEDEKAVRTLVNIRTRSGR